jgi:hypothetical protein
VCELKKVSFVGRFLRSLKNISPPRVDNMELIEKFPNNSDFDRSVMNAAGERLLSISLFAATRSGAVSAGPSAPRSIAEARRQNPFFSIPRRFLCFHGINFVLACLEVCTVPRLVARAGAGSHLDLPNLSGMNFDIFLTLI